MDGRSPDHLILMRDEAWNFKLDCLARLAHGDFKLAPTEDASIFEVRSSDSSHISLRCLIGFNARYGATLQADLDAASIPVE